MDVASIASNANAISKTDKNDIVENPKGTIDKDGFLKLLIAQLKYQDPLNPLNNDEFIQENTGFSQLEQLQNLNSAIKDISSSFNKSDKGYAASYLGKYIAIDSNSIKVSGSKIDPVQFHLAEDADVKVSIVDKKGNNVANIDLGKLKAGNHKFTWNGKDNKGNYVPSGTYSVSLSAVTSDGSSVPIEKNAGKVVAVQFDSSGIVLVTNQNEKVNLNDVKSVFEGGG